VLRHYKDLPLGLKPLRDLSEALVWAKERPGCSDRALYSSSEPGERLLDFGFFVHHMFTYHGIKFFDLHFFRHVTFVFRGGVKVTGASTG
jgi:hypothetical protein